MRQKAPVPAEDRPAFVKTQVVLLISYLIVYCFFLLDTITAHRDVSEAIFHSARILFTIATLLFARARRKPRYHVASISEMSDAAYYLFAHTILAVHSVAYLYLSENMPDVVKQIQASIIIVTIFILLVLYHQKPWVRNNQRLRVQRIQQLTKKANLNQTEISALSPMLIQNTSRKYSPPVYWRLVKWVVIFLLGSILSIYAEGVIEYIQNIGVLHILS